ALGEGTTRFEIGDRVFGMVGGGGYAEALVAHERALARIPGGLSFEQAAAVPEAFVTAHDALVGQMGLSGGDTLLVHAVGSGIGTAAVQLGRALGAFVIGTSRTADKLERAKALGLDAGIVPDPGFADAVRRLDPTGASVVLELVGAAYLAEDFRAVRTCGRIALIGLLGGARAELDLGVVLGKRIRIHGSVLRPRPLEEKIAAMRAFEDRVVPLFARGRLVPVVHTVLDLDRAAEAHALMASNTGFGKIVLRV